MNPETIAKIQKVAALLDSPVDGEAKAAAEQLRRLLQAHNLTMRDVMAATNTTVLPDAAPQHPAPAPVADEKRRLSLFKVYPLTVCVLTVLFTFLYEGDTKMGDLAPLALVMAMFFALPVALFIRSWEN